MSLKKSLITFFICPILLTISDEIAAQVSNVTIGVWSNPSTWENNHIPTATDSVVLNFDITIDSNCSCRALNTNGHEVVINAGVNLVINRPLSTEKEILSFAFNASQNLPVLSSDIGGDIENDTIKLFLPPSTPLFNLIPTITFSGISVSPASDSSIDFTNPVNYYVTAEDSSVRKYTVICYINFAMFFAGSDSTIYAVDATTGKEIWRKFVGKIIFSPTADVDKVYVVCGDNYLYALDNKTGANIWQYRVGNDNSIPSVQNGIVYIKGSNYMNLIDATSGTLIKKTLAVGVNPTIANNKMYLPRSLYGGLSAKDITTETSMWSFGGNSICESNPALNNDTLYVGDELNTLTALNANSGVVKWTVPRETAAGGSKSAPTYCNSIAYIVDNNNKLFAIDANNGNIKWSKIVDLNHMIYNPVAYNNTLYVTSATTVFALDGVTGNERWNRNFFTTGSFGSCTCANNILYVGNSDGYVYAVDVISGNLKWKYRINNAVVTNICVLDFNGIVFHSGDSGDQH